MRSLRKTHSYEAYKELIIKTAQQLGFIIQSYSPYPNKNELQTILIYNKALLRSPKAYLLISATHGGEGPAGAEVQLQLLESQGQELLNSSSGFLMIFALNPFGFHYLRRTSIENIDLNRNTGDGLAPAPLGPVHEWVRPLWRSHSFGQQIRGLAQSFCVGVFKGFYSVARTFAVGQSLEPEGLFYSGTQKAVEIQSLFVHIGPLLENKTSLSVIDVHTGLGELYGEMLIHCSGDSEKSKTLFKRPIEIPGEKPKSYRGAGLLADRFALEFPKADLHFVVQEFGVKSTARTFFILSLENQYHWKLFEKVSDAIYLRHPIKDMFFDTFFSTKPKWLKWLREEGTTRFMQIFGH